MATRSRLIEGTWNCTSCDSKGILARFKKCPTCNNPREDGAETNFDFGETDADGRLRREGVTDEKAQEVGKLGPDWFCAFCAASNRDDAVKCKNCQAPRSEAEAKKAAETPLNAPTAAASSGGKMSMEEAARFVETQKAAAAKSRSSMLRWGLVLGVLVFGTCIGTSWWGSRESDHTGKISAMTWTRKVELQSFAPVEAQDWRSNLSPRTPRMPVNGSGEIAGVQNVHGCVSKQSGTKQVPDGQERVCHTHSKSVQCGTTEKCTTVNKGNGFAQESCTDVPKYCNESYEECGYETRYKTVPVFADWCRYTTYQWTTKDSRVADGRDAKPRWPDGLTAGSLDRLLRTEQYKIVLDYQDGKKQKSHTMEPATEAEFTMWRPEQKVKVTATNFGDVTKVEPAQ
ncbi:MAG: hypothetical protein ACJ790_03755 [Myxococcaceae bacterium]